MASNGIENSSSSNRIVLGRGGVIINTKKIGAIQIGIPPETIKDCMNLGISIPNYYVFPKELFDREKGVNVAEAEFPAYFNFFILNKVVNFICTSEQEVRMREVFQQTLLGPKEIDIRKEFVASFPPSCIPDLKKECAYIRTFHSIDELFHFIHFDEKGVAHIGDSVEILNNGNEFLVVEDGLTVGSAPVKVNFTPEPWQRSIILGNSDRKPFDPPMFGVTILGSGHGFDPSHRTSGFVLWLNRRGIMVDPPLNSRGILHSSGVPSRLIDSLIITHCHADHDEGTFQKILEETQIELITTPLILSSFLRKYSALSGLSEDYLRRLFTYRPVQMGESMRINGGEIRFVYSIHTIPCIGFEVFYGGKSLYFSSDTCYDPSMIAQMRDKGVIPAGRADWWINFNWHHNLILHECGVPPIHTSVKILSEFPEDVKRRLYLVHTSAKLIPSESKLKIAPEGVENTLVLPVTPHIHAEAIALLKLVDSIDMFHSFSLSQAREILLNACSLHYSADSKIFSKGDDGNEFFIIASGIVTINDDNDDLHQSWTKHLVSGDYFGEMALVTGSKRTATAKAKTEVDLVSFTKEDFLSILRGHSEIVEFILNLSRRRQEPSWAIISSNTVLSQMTNAQKTRFQALLGRREIKRGDHLWHAGEHATFAYLIGEGIIQFVEREDLAPFTSGAFIGEVNALLSENEGIHKTSVIIVESGWVYTITRNDLCTFFDRNPGIRLAFHDTIFIDTIKEDNLNQNLSGNEVRF